MTLFFNLLPIYLVGNLHCLGMCGPLVVMMGKHRYRYGYFIGRMVAFSLAGTLAGWLGAGFALESVQPTVALVFGCLLCLMGVGQLLPLKRLRWNWLQSKKQGLDQKLSLLLLQDQPMATFLFGLATPLLPCGQTFLVFSACALSGSPWVGLLNGFAFALLTSPSLFFAMQAHSLLRMAKSYYRPILAFVMITAGLWMCYRGAAGLNLAPAPCHMCEEAGRK